MINLCRAGLLLLVTTTFSLSLVGQTKFFAESRTITTSVTNGKRVIIPDLYKTFVLDNAGIQNFLNNIPVEKGQASRFVAPVLELPLPNGGFAKYRVWETPIMEPALAEKFPNIKTYTGQGIDDPTAIVKIDITELGFHAMIMSDVTGHIFIDPYRQLDTRNYIVYFKKDLKNSKYFVEEGVEAAEYLRSRDAQRFTAGSCVGSELRTFRIAVACTGEYARAVTGITNPTVAQVLSAIVTSINRVDGVFEKEVAVSLNLVADNDKIVFVNPATDPFTANNDGSELLNESQSVITQHIGAANYDIGHTFSTGGGGIAQVESVCGAQKARGVTGATNPVGDPYDIDFVAHEIGHQFGANHSFNAISGACNGNRSASTAVEPGSGVTIMAYAGICGLVNNITDNSIPYFHATSMDEINSFVASGNGASCAIITPTGNTAPLVDAGNDYIIPRSTTFVLAGTATDAEGDVLTYSWEQVDTGPAGTWDAPSGNAPLFRSFAPEMSPLRYFPRLADQVRNTSTKGEILPTYGRSMNFRLTARDNRAGGSGVCNDEMKVTVNAASGPFVLTYPSAAGISWNAGSTQTVTWNVANTNNAPVNCSHVSIQLSIDSGYTFPITILASTPNDGSEQIVVPNNISNKARIRVIAVDNIFYDMSNNNFEIASPLPGFNFSIPSDKVLGCANPGETTASITLETQSILGYTTPIAITASGEPAGSSVSISNTSVIPGQNTSITLNNVNTLAYGTYSITVRGESGSIVKEQKLIFVVQQGAGPAITVHPQDVAVCANANALFSVSSASPISAYQWQVSTNNGASFVNLANETGPMLNVVNTTPGQDNNRYRVLITGQCNISTSNAALLTVHALPTIGLAANLLTTLTPGQQTILSATPSPANGSNIILSWIKDQVPIAVSGSSLPVQVSDIGNYQVIIDEVWPDGNTCSGISPLVAITAAPSSQLFVYPSPNNGRFIVSYYNAASGSTRQSVTIYDAKGARVYYREFTFAGPYELHDVDISGKAKGVYFIVIGDASGKKIIEGKVLLN